MGKLTLSNVNCIDTEKWIWNKNKNIEITNGVITDIYDSSLKVKDKGIVQDFTDCWVIPGLVDMHVHYTWSYDMNTPDYFTDKDDVLALAYNNLSELISCGITTCRDMGSFQYSAEMVKNKLRYDYSVPDMITCGKVLTYLDGHLHEFANEIQNAGDIEAALINNMSAGADFIKVASDPFDFEARKRFPNPAFDERFLKEIVRVAHDNGKYVACHTYPSYIGVDRALKSGIRTIEHAVPFDSKMESDTYPDVYYVPTFATAVDVCGFQRIEESDSIKNKESFLKVKGMTEVINNGTVPESICEWLDFLLKNVPVAIKKNQFICTGSDAGCKGTSFSTLLREMLFLSAMGASNQQVLMYSITNPYNALGIYNKGQIKKGFIADLVVLRENPLENIRALVQNVAVVRYGNCIKTI